MHRVKQDEHMYSRASRYSSPLQVFPGQERLLSLLLPDRSPRERSLPTSRCFQPLRANPSAAASSRGGTARTPPPLPGNPLDLPPRRAAPHRTRAARCTPPAPPGLGPHLQRSGRSHRPPCPAQFSPKIKAPGPALAHPTCLFPFLHFFPGFFPLPIFSLLFTSPFSSHPFSYPRPFIFPFFLSFIFLFLPFSSPFSLYPVFILFFFFFLQPPRRSSPPTHPARKSRAIPQSALRPRRGPALARCRSAHCHCRRRRPRRALSNVRDRPPPGRDRAAPPEGRAAGQRPPVAHSHWQRRGAAPGRGRVGV